MDDIIIDTVIDFNLSLHRKVTDSERIRLEFCILRSGRKLYAIGQPVVLTS